MIDFQNWDNSIDACHLWFQVISTHNHFQPCPFRNSLNECNMNHMYKTM